MTDFVELLRDTRVTLEQAVKHAADEFDRHQLEYGHGTHNAFDEALWLTLHAMGLSPLVSPDFSRELTEDNMNAYQTVMQRRVTERIPAAYITGKTWFAGHEILCDSRALVPRSPLAEFINSDCFGLTDVNGIRRVLDLCTGGGCIAIACAHQWPQTQVDASDLSANALSLAEENVVLHGLENRVHLVESALFELLDQRYDLILSNPPYVDAADINAMSDEFRHEPLLGLAAGTDGLDLVRTMLVEAASYLTDTGLLVVEVGNSAEALENAYPDVPFLWLEIEYGGGGVFALTRQELDEHKEVLAFGA